LERLGIGGLALDHDNPAPFTGCGQLRIRLLHREECPIHHQTDVTEDEQPSEQQEHFFGRPAVRTHDVALLNHVVQHGLPTAPSAEIDIRAEVLDGLGIALFHLHRQRLLANVIAPQHRLDFLQGTLGCVVDLPEVAHFIEGIGDEVFQGFCQGGHKSCRCDLERLTGHEILGLRQRVSEELGQPFAPLAIVLSQITVDTLDRLRKGAITLGLEILVRLQGGTQLTAQTLLVIEPYQDVTAVLRTVQDALVILGGLVPIRQRCEHGHE